jgi:hypothetical protein
MLGALALPTFALALGISVLTTYAPLLLGDWNWYLPSRLEWLPQVSHETEAAPRTVPAPAPAGR